MLQSFAAIDQAAYAFIFSEAICGIAASEITLAEVGSPEGYHHTVTAVKAHGTVMQLRTHVAMNTEEAEALAILIVLLRERLLRLGEHQRHGWDSSVEHAAQSVDKIQKLRGRVLPALRR
jgi:hypothetical protein